MTWDVEVVDKDNMIFTPVGIGCPDWEGVYGGYPFARFIPKTRASDQGQAVWMLGLLPQQPARGVRTVVSVRLSIDFLQPGLFHMRNQQQRDPG